jgi:ribosomal protein S18 acetylase RimI-like enzyme
VNNVFPLQEPEELSDFWLPKSLEFRRQAKLEFGGVKRLGYHVAVEGRKVIGIIGLYCMDEDSHEAYWIGWFCVNPAFRGRGLGSKLLDLAIKNTKADGKRFLRLYTSDDPNESAAQRLYEKKGFSVSRENVRKRGKYNIFYREKEL